MVDEKFICRPLAPKKVFPLDTQGHDGVDNIIVILFQSFYGLLATDVGLGHDKLNILILKTFSIDLLAVVVVVFLLSLARFDSLARLTVVVAGVLSLGISGGHLSSSGLLSGGINILDLSLTKNTA